MEDLSNSTQQVAGNSEGIPQDVMGMIGHVSQQQEQMSSKLSKSEEVLGKLEKVFSRSEEKNSDEWYDDVLRTALEAEKQGQPIPLTVKISTELRNAQKSNEQLMKEIQELKAKNQIKENPNFQADQAAYNHIDMFMSQELKNAFGQNVPKAVAVAVTQDLVQKIQDEQRTNPERWKEIRSNPQLMQRIARNAVAQTIPQQARQLSHQYQQENAVYSPDEIKENIAEAQQLLRSAEVRSNPDYARKVEASIVKMREMYWESLIPGQQRKAKI
jgi:hypothetical protein